MAELVTLGHFVGPGERRAAQLLRAELPDGWLVVCNKEIVRQSGSVREADFIVVGDHTVFVVEEKYWRGHLRGNDVAWVLPSGESVSSPLTQPEGAVRALDGMLRSSIPELKRLTNDAKASGREPHFVFARLFLSHPDVRADIDDPRTEEKLVTTNNVAANLTRFDRRFNGAGKRQRGLSISHLRDQIIRRLTALPDRPAIPETIGDYTVIELQGGVQDGIRSVKARHEDGTERLLRLIPKPDELNTQRFTAERARFLREYESLRRLSETGFAPRVESYFSWDQSQFWVVPMSIPPGISLGADVATGLPSRDRIVETLIRAYSSLAVVHETDVVHRQLSPECVWIGAEVVWFSDFSAARLVGAQTIVRDEDTDESDPYRAPECRSGLQFASPNSDVYSLAASCLYWVTGVVPSADPILEARGLASRRPDLSGAFGRDLAAFLSACLAADPVKRPSAGEAVDVLDRLQELAGETQPHGAGVPYGPLAKTEVLELWQEAHKTLSEELSREFLSRGELNELIALDAPWVRWAIRRRRMLKDILTEARNGLTARIYELWSHRYGALTDAEMEQFTGDPSVRQLMSYSEEQIASAFEIHRQPAKAVEHLQQTPNGDPEQTAPALPGVSAARSSSPSKTEAPLGQRNANEARGPRIIKGRFAIPQAPVHSTTWADVYKASDLANENHPVAVKILKRTTDPEIVRILFERERQSLGALEHPNIVRLIDAGRDADTDDYFLVLEWIPRNLSDYLEAEELGGWDDFAETVALPLCRALAFAHERGVVHRDVKPNNVLVDELAGPKLADFGISKIKTQLARDAGTVAEFFSPPFCPPDLESVSSTNRDVFGLGVLMLSALSETAVEEYFQFDRALQEIDVVPEVRDILRRCVSLTPEDRPENALVLLGTLESIQRTRQARWSSKEPVHLVPQDPVLRKLSRELDMGSLEEAKRFLGEELNGTVYGELDRDGHALRIYTEAWRFILEEVGANSPYFFVTKAYKAGPGQQDAARDRSLELPFRFTLDHPLNFDKATQARRILSESLIDFQDSRHEEREVREEQRIFEQWSNQLFARERAEERKAPPLAFSGARSSGRRVYLTLEDDPLEDHVGEPRMIAVEGSQRAVFSGEVEAVAGRRLTLYLRRDARGEPPPRGVLVLDIHASRQAIKRQRDALRAIRNPERPELLRADLGELIVHPERCRSPVDVSVHDWTAPDLDDDKKLAVSRALGSEDFLTVQGPPGTGKTTLIAELITQEWRRNPQARILLTSQTHIAVDNALERMREIDSAFRMVRVGASAGPLADRVADLTMDHQLEQWRLTVKSRSEEFIRRWASENNADLAVVRRLVLLRRLREAKESLAERSREIAEASQLLEEAPATSTPLSDSERMALSDRISDLRAERTKRRRDVESIAAELSPLVGETASVLEKKSIEDLSDLVPSGSPEIPSQIQELVDVQERWLMKLGRGPEFEEALLYASNVIGGTCIGIAGIRSLENIEFDLCILDEASKATATESLVPFVRGRRWVMVGDQAQLPPFQDDALRDPELQKEFDLDQNELRQTLFDRMCSGLPAENQVLLTSQHRMVRPIGDLISRCFYDGKLVSARASAQDEFSLVLERPVMWLDTGASPERRERDHRRGHERSFHNSLETRLIGQALTRIHDRMKWLANQRKGMAKTSVLVLSGYRAQVAQIAGRLDAKRHELGDFLDIEVNTVDSAQGREADILVFSVTRSNGTGTLGFLASEARINVALSRGRSALLIVGDLEFCASQGGPLRRVAEYIRNHPEDCGVEVEKR